MGKGIRVLSANETWGMVAGYKTIVNNYLNLMSDYSDGRADSNDVRGSRED